MNKPELISAVQGESGLSKADTARAVEALLTTIQKQLAQGEAVNIFGFGAFSVHIRKPRKGRNPKTGEAMDIPGAKVPAFRPGKALRELVNH